MCARVDNIAVVLSRNDVNLRGNGYQKSEGEPFDQCDNCFQGQDSKFCKHDGISSILAKQRSRNRRGG